MNSKASPWCVPAQLRKLVQVRKEGDKVELGYYRGGKKQTVTVTLGKAPPGYGLLEDGEALKGDLAGLSPANSGPCLWARHGGTP